MVGGMRTLLVARAGVSAVFLFLGACMAVAETVPDSAKEAAEKAGPARGLVWKIEGGKTDVYLAGSFHLLRKKDLPYPSTLDAAYEATQQVWFETPPAEMQKPAAAAHIMAIGMLPADKSLDDVIKPETYAKVEKWAEDNPALAPVLDRMRPWLAAVTIMITEYQQRMGISPEHGIEMQIQGLATKDGKATGGFETVEQQLSMFGDLSAKQQEELLDKTFDDLESSQKLLEDMIAHWRAGRDKELAEQMAKSFEGHDALKKRLLDDRNAAWIDPIEKLLAGDTPTLVVVGAGHLAGDGSVIELLEKKGWKLSRVEPKP